MTISTTLHISTACFVGVSMILQDFLEHGYTKVPNQGDERLTLLRKTIGDWSKTRFHITVFLYTIDGARQMSAQATLHLNGDEFTVHLENIRSAEETTAFFHDLWLRTKIKLDH